MQKNGQKRRWRKELGRKAGVADFGPYRRVDLKKSQCLINIY
jgi:hypothetical protein